MDTKDVVEYIAKSPPQPHRNGCARIALRPFLRGMQIVGAYHEYDYYANWDKRTGSKKNHVDTGDAHRDDVAVFYASEKLPVMISSAAGNHDKMFTRRDISDGVTANQGFIDVKNNKDVRRRDIKITKTDIFVPDNLSALNDSSLFVSAVDGLPHAVRPLSLGSSENFLEHCGIVHKRVTREQIESLGYDLPSELFLEEPVAKDKVPCSLGSCMKAFWSDRTYGFVMMLLHWANVLRCVIYINHESHVGLMTALVPVLWYLMVAACNTAMFVSCVKRDHFYAFFSMWAIIFQDPTTRALGLRGVLNNKFIKIVVFIQWFVTMFNVGCVVFLTMMEDSFSASMNRLFLLTGRQSNVVIAVSAVGTFFTSVAWTGGNAFIAVLCYHVQTHFKEFGKVLRLHIAAAGNEFPQSLNLLRERHLAMCENVAVLDRYMSITISVSYGVYISLACLLLYQLVRIPMDASVIAILVFWFVSIISLVTIITFSMASVNDAMHAASGDLYPLQTRHMTLEQFGQLQMFLAKVNGPNLGFSVLGLIVITRELMLTLFGIFLTYGIVLLQFPGT